MRSTSVIIPTYNAEQYIGSAIESVLQQSREVSDVCIVDDGSTDNTESVVSRYGSRVRYIRQENQGPAAARNRALRECRAECIIFLDADDLLDRQCVETLNAGYEKAASRGRVGGVYGDYWLVDADSRYCRRVSVGKVDKKRLLVDPCLIPSGTLITQECIRSVGGFDPTLNTAEDWDYWLQIVCAGFSFVKVPGITCLHREHPGSLSKNQGHAIAQKLRLLQRWETDPRMEEGDRRILRAQMARTHLRIVRANIYTERSSAATDALACALKLRPELIGDPLLIAYCTVYAAPFFRETVSQERVSAAISSACQTVHQQAIQLDRNPEHVEVGRYSALAADMFMRRQWVASLIQACRALVRNPFLFVRLASQLTRELARVRCIWKSAGRQDFRSVQEQMIQHRPA